MSNFPDFSQLGYQVIRELGRNREAGRITYLATITSPAPNFPLSLLRQDGTGEIKEVQVVLKEFRFANMGVDWSGFKAYQREIEVLQQLEHPRIPHYLDSFETSQGFCLVQEYKNAPSLIKRHNFKPEDIKQIAVSVLEILAYLQQRTPPIIHRDIKPENILVDKQLNAYLVDFGLARIRTGEVALSSVAAGTPGFMPPEEQFGRPLTKASDLYSLGATLICLLTGTRSVDIGKLIDDNYHFEFKRLVPQLGSRFVEWLTKMVEPNLKNRYTSAAIALAALKPIQMQGGATRLEILGSAIELRMGVSLIGIATLGAFALLSTTGIIHKSKKAVKIANPHTIVTSRPIQTPQDLFSQLLQTRECLGCDLRKAYLEGANLRATNLGGANLEDAYLEGANLEDANLRGAYLGGAYLGHANLEAANLKGAYLGRTYLAYADLGGAYLGGADLVSANLKGANLVKANLEGAYLGRTYLGGAHLEDTYLRGAHLEGAHLEGAHLEGAHLEGADLEGAHLKGAIMPDGTKHD